MYRLEFVIIHDRTGFSYWFGGCCWLTRLCSGPQKCTLQSRVPLLAFIIIKKHQTISDSCGTRGQNITWPDDPEPGHVDGPVLRDLRVPVVVQHQPGHQVVEVPATKINTLNVLHDDLLFDNGSDNNVI